MTRVVRKQTSVEDARKVPAYTLSEAAHYLRVSESKLRSWIRRRPALIRAAKPADPIMLSFENLIEVYVLETIRRVYGIPMSDIDVGLRYAGADRATDRPLHDVEFLTDGTALWFDSSRRGFVSATEPGQRLLDEKMFRAYMDRIERNPKGLAVRFYPPLPGEADHDRRRVSMDPRVAFGQPVLRGTRIPTRAIADRFYAGESMSDLAADYGRPAEEIELALRCEKETQAAA